jgi:hypothetical protein
MAGGLANPEPSTHGTTPSNRDVRSTVTVRGDMKRTPNSVENTPQPTFQDRSNRVAKVSLELL